VYLHYVHCSAIDLPVLYSLGFGNTLTLISVFRNDSISAPTLTLISGFRNDSISAPTLTLISGFRNDSISGVGFRVRVRPQP